MVEKETLGYRKMEWMMNEKRRGMDGTKEHVADSRILDAIPNHPPAHPLTVTVPENSDRHCRFLLLGNQAHRWGRPQEEHCSHLTTL